MSKILFTIVIPNDDRHVRKKSSPPERVIRDKKSYSRKQKHKKNLSDEVRIY